MLFALVAHCLLLWIVQTCLLVCAMRESLLGVGSITSLSFGFYPVLLHTHLTSNVCFSMEVESIFQVHKLHSFVSTWGSHSNSVDLDRLSGLAQSHPYAVQRQCRQGQPTGYKQTLLSFLANFSQMSSVPQVGT